MPALSFHIKVANDIAKILELTDEEKNLFILSNLIPDIKSGYLFSVETTIEPKYSHYYNLNTDIRLPDLEKYEKKYLKNDIVSIKYKRRIQKFCILLKILLTTLYNNTMSLIYFNFIMNIICNIINHIIFWFNIN